ncbi:Galactitol 1-phosphate 5-dehydrogenase [bioreactor metagenome]|uniref:Galactitol 1-phosphate 5-dehydrogenase n=1 Tax=bioreactor metagenome TaxID=1076179 RepID=A0A645IFQ1_9ZZZZ
MELGDNVAIFGAGAIGLMLAEFAKAWGAGRVIPLDVENAKIDFARGIGFLDAVNNAEPDWEEKIYALTEGKGADIAVEGAGVPPALAGALRIAKPQGKVVLMGNPAGDMPLNQHDYWEILRKQLTVLGTWNSSYTQKKNDWKIALQMMAQGRIDVKKFITHRFPLREANTAFEMIRDKTEFSNRVMFIND